MNDLCEIFNYSLVLNFIFYFVNICYFIIIVNKEKETKEINCFELNETFFSKLFNKISHPNSINELVDSIRIIFIIDSAVSTKKFHFYFRKALMKILNNAVVSNDIYKEISLYIISVLTRIRPFICEELVQVGFIPLFYTFLRFDMHSKEIEKATIEAASSLALFSLSKSQALIFLRLFLSVIDLKESVNRTTIKAMEGIMHISQNLKCLNILCDQRIIYFLLNLIMFAFIISFI